MAATPRGAAKPDVSVTAPARKTLRIELVGKSYKVTAPKAILALILGVRISEAGEDALAIFDAVKDWVHAAFTEADAERVLARLGDPKDDLDLSHLMQLMEALVEYGQADPTSSRSG